MRCLTYIILNYIFPWFLKHYPLSEKVNQIFTATCVYKNLLFYYFSAFSVVFHDKNFDFSFLSKPLLPHHIISPHEVCQALLPLNVTLTRRITRALLTLIKYIILMAEGKFCYLLGLMMYKTKLANTLPFLCQSLLYHISCVDIFFYLFIPFDPKAWHIPILQKQ